MYVEPRKMVLMNRFAGQKLRHRCREQTYGHQVGKASGGGKKKFKLPPHPPLSKRGLLFKIQNSFLFNFVIFNL